MDCRKYYLCSGALAPVCICNGEECSFDSEPMGNLFLRRHGDELIGSFSGALFFGDEGHLTTLGTIRFRRVEE